jgi:hypothetical protein
LAGVGRCTFGTGDHFEDPALKEIVLRIANGARDQVSDGRLPLGGHEETIGSGDGIQSILLVVAHHGQTDGLATRFDYVGVAADPVPREIVRDLFGRGLDVDLSRLRDEQTDFVRLSMMSQTIHLLI